MKLLYNIFVVNDSDPGNPDYETPKVRLSYIGGATGTAKGRIYKTGDPPPAFAAITGLFEIAATPGETYEVEYQDDAVALKHLGTVSVHAWVGGCFEDIDTINWLNVYRFSGKVQVSWYGSTALAISIDGGSTYKNAIFSGISWNAEWTDSELDILGFTDTIPNVKTRRVFLQDEQTVTGFADPADVDWPSSNFTRANMADSSAFIVGSVVNFQPNTNYGSGTVVEQGAGYIIFQHSLNGNPVGVQVGYNVGCVTNILDDFFIGELVIAPFTLSESHTNVTVNDGNDGAILLTVAGGSGSFTYAWADGPATQNRSNLPAGTYTVTVTDTVTLQEEELSIVITEPVAVVTEGTFLRVPLMNSLHFVDRSVAIDPITNPQALDNRLLCEQQYPGYDQTNYFQKVCQADSRNTQFESDYSNFLVRLYDYYTQELVKTFGFTLKEQNIGVASDYGIVIKDNPDPLAPGTSRVYFNVAALPIPLQAGDGFTIMNNADGFNGSYAIVDIENDLTLGYQYLVINRAYTPVAVQSLADGRFYTSAVDFNVFETFKEFNDVPEGDYFVRIQALNLSGVPTIHMWESEPIAIRELHPNTNLVEYKNVDNAFDMTWTTGYIGQIRVESTFGHNRPTGGERSVSRDADFSLTKINAKKQRVLLFSTMELPPYLHEKLSVVFDCDYFAINKLECQANEAYGEATYADRYLLGASSIKVEQKHWFKKYNSNDIGTVNEFPNTITVDNTEVTVDSDEITIDQTTF